MNLYGGQIDGIFGNLTGGAIQKFERDNGITPWTGKFNKKVRDKMRLKGYSTGGLADFTGPAWLDGTKARPELVLNARDT
jgi:peptidoglycan hydrolase-like protein with peptidoglycan-binding domain